jgi:ferric-dicitrate binding protein FerR (iron transport regulator)
MDHSDTDYAAFDITDFAADEFFVSWALDPDEESDRFWTCWQQEHPGKARILHEARLLVLLMHSRPFRVEEERKKQIWQNIQQLAFTTKSSEQALHHNGVQTRRKIYHLRSFWYQVAAMLVLTTGIFYTTNKLWQNDGHVVTENARGKKSIIYLPDGTKVWLNAESRITYPSAFKDLAVREVSLEGEAFFDVTENKDKPFIVKTSRLHLKVLGTAFNVKSYSNESTVETTLLRGKVMVEVDDEGDRPLSSMVLKENEQAVYSTVSNQLSLSRVQAESVVSWKEGKLVFVNKPFAEIETELERWYGVEIIRQDQTKADCRFTTSIENEPITKILELFRATSDVTYEINDNTITLKGNICP